MLEPYEQRSFNHPLIGLYEKLKRNSGYLAFCYRYHSTELSRYFCVCSHSFSLPASLSTYILIYTKISKAWSQKAKLPFRMRWQLHFWMHLKVIQIVTSAMGGCGYALGRLLRYEVVCLFLSFDLWSSEDLRSKIAFDPCSFMTKIIQISKVIIKARGLWSQSNLLCYVTLH